MPVNSKLLEVLPEDYGYVLLVGVASGFVNFWMARRVGKARKEYGIEYPDMYSPDNKMFNCIQRAHQNTMEMYPSFMFLLLTSGLQYPRISAGAGVIYLLGRIQFARGYYTGDPAKRRKGAFGAIGLLCLLGGTVSLAAHHLKWC